MLLRRHVFSFLAVCCSVVFIGCSESSNPQADQTGVAPSQTLAEGQAVTADYTQPPQQVDFNVYKSPTCGCCGDWVTHLEDNGFSASSVHPEDLIAVKQAWGIAPELQSCHTAVSREGYVFEGHIPAHVIQRFLAERPPNALGLVVPGMPVGSPGMEIDNKFEAYDVLLLRKDGRTELFTRITKP